MRAAAIVCALVFSSWSADAACNYDSAKCGTTQNTMCTYSGVSASCGAPESQVRVPLTSAHQDALVNYHNEVRSKVAKGLETRPQPALSSATNMKQMTWDDELAKIAQRWAEQCVMGHDQCRNVLNGRFPSVGQNYAMSANTAWTMTTPVNPAMVIKRWYEDEVDYVSKSIIDSFQMGTDSTKQYAHYTQMIWANTNKVGCGMVRYPKPPFLYWVVVCNYGPGGNYIGDKVYQSGNKCSGCASGSCDPSFDGLCKIGE